MSAEEQPGVAGNEPMADYPEYPPMAYCEVKPWYASRTIGVALATSLLAGLNALTDTIQDPRALSLFIALAAGISVWLRAQTGGPVQFRRKRRHKKQ